MSDSLAIRDVAAIQTASVEIPPNLDAAEEWLEGTVAIQQLLLASEWGKAAIIRAFTEPGEGGPRELSKSGQLETFRQFSERRITGLRSASSVSRYYQAWEYAREVVPDLPIPEPGMLVPLPLHLKFPRIKVEQEPPPQLPAGIYDVLLADPPWQYDFAETDNRAIENQYPTMSVETICELAVQGIAAENAVLFLWATAPKLQEAMDVIAAWGFTYTSQFVWVKDKIGMGYWARGRHELLLIGKRGHFPPPDEADRFDSVIEAPRLKKHSAKPELVYDMVETMCPDRTYVELFARSGRDGWTSWGNEV